VRPGFDFDWRVPGFLLVDPERLHPSADAVVAQHLEQGFSLHAIDGEQVRLLEPALRGDMPPAFTIPPRLMCIP